MTNKVKFKKLKNLLLNTSSTKDSNLTGDLITANNIAEIKSS